jgi:hypothetical protein
MGDINTRTGGIRHDFILNDDISFVSVPDIYSDDENLEVVRIVIHMLDPLMVSISYLNSVCLQG